MKSEISYNKEFGCYDITLSTNFLEDLLKQCKEGNQICFPIKSGLLIGE